MEGRALREWTRKKQGGDALKGESVNLKNERANVIDGSFFRGSEKRARNVCSHQRLRQCWLWVWLSIATLSACYEPPPRVEKIRFPSGFVFSPGPFPVKIKVLGKVDDIQIHWTEQRADGTQPEYTQTPMVSVGDGYWTGELPDVPPKTVVRFHLILTGEFETQIYPTRHAARFVVRSQSASCSSDDDDNGCSAGGECTTNDDCPAHIPLCNEGRCRPRDQGAQCRLDDDCPPNMARCLEGHCVPVADGAECGLDSQCPSHRPRCLNGRCVTSDGHFECTTDMECMREDVRCVDGRCVPSIPNNGCLSNPCPPGLLCDATGQRCVQCVRGDDCLSGLCNPDGQCAESPMPMCGQDGAEPNDVWNQATVLSMDRDYISQTCIRDLDIFRVTMPGGLVEFTGRTGSVALTQLDGGGRAISNQAIVIGSQEQAVFDLAGGGVSVLGQSATDSVMVRLRPREMERSCFPDDFEINDTIDDARRLGGGGSLIRARVCSGDIDVFRIVRQRANPLGEVLLASDRRLRAELIGPDGQAVYQGDILSPQAIEYPPETGEIFLILTCPDCNQTGLGTDYRLATRYANDTQEDQDVLEPNSTVGDAANIGNAPQRIEPLMVTGHSPDYFSLSVPTGRQYRISVEFNEFVGDVDLAIVNRDSGQMFWATQSPSPEGLNLDAGSYTLIVSLFGAGRVDYSLAIENL